MRMEDGAVMFCMEFMKHLLGDSFHSSHDAIIGKINVGVSFYCHALWTLHSPRRQFIQRTLVTRGLFNNRTVIGGGKSFTIEGRGFSTYLFTTIFQP